MTHFILVVLLVLLVVNTLVTFLKKPKLDLSSNFDKTVNRLDTILDCFREIDPKPVKR